MKESLRCLPRHGWKATSMRRTTAVHPLAWLLLTLFTSPVAWAALGGPTGILVPYRGHLDVDGQPVNSTVPYAFRFTLHDAEVGGTSCATEYDATSTVSGGDFSVVVGPVDPACVVGKAVFLSVAVKAPAAGSFVPLAGRQRVVPSLGALTSGQGDFAVAGRVDAASVQATGPVAAGSTLQSGTTLTVGTNAQVQGTLSVGSSAQVTGALTAAGGTSTPSLTLTGSAGSIVLNNRPVYLRTPGDTNHGLAHRPTFGSAAQDGPALFGYSGGVLGTTSGGERAALQWDSNSNVAVTGNLAVAGTGGNVPHACVIRSQTGSYNTACQAGEIAVGGGGRCSSLWRLTESAPWGGALDSNPPQNGQPAVAWRAVCQIWGDNGGYTPPQLGVFAICCRQ
jgi:hypothetical protein